MLGPVLRILPMPSDVALTTVVSNRYNYFNARFTEEGSRAWQGHEPGVQGRKCMAKCDRNHGIPRVTSDCGRTLGKGNPAFEKE